MIILYISANKFCMLFILCTLVYLQSSFKSTNLLLMKKKIRLYIILPLTQHL